MEKMIIYKEIITTGATACPPFHLMLWIFSQKLELG